MYRAGWWLIPVVAVTLLIGGGIGAFIADRNDEAHDSVVQVTRLPDAQTGEPTQVVQIERDGRWGHGGFFPGFLLFPLLWIGLLFFVFGAFRRGRHWDRWDDRMDDWHRRQHDGPSQSPPPSSPANA